MQKRVFQILVDNTAGVLSRISGLFSRRGFNIESITAGVTADPRFTRITIVAAGEEVVLEQIEKQLAKLIDVKSIKELEPNKSVYRELALVKIKVDASNRQEVTSLTDIYRAKIVDVCSESLTVEITGTQSKIEAFVNLISGFEILELARTGLVGLVRGAQDVVHLDE